MQAKERTIQCVNIPTKITFFDEQENPVEGPFTLREMIDDADWTDEQFDLIANMQLNQIIIIEPYTITRVE